MSTCGVPLTVLAHFSRDLFGLMACVFFIGRGMAGNLGGYGYAAPGPSYPSPYQSPSLYTTYDPNSGFPVGYPGSFSAGSTYGAGTYGAAPAAGYEFSSPSGFGAVRYPGKVVKYPSLTCFKTVTSSVHIEGCFSSGSLLKEFLIPTGKLYLVTWMRGGFNSCDH